MKVYLLHETTVDLDDHYTKILGCYADKNLAEKEKERLEKKFKLSQKCEHCPLYKCPDRPEFVLLSPCDSCNQKEICINSRIERTKAYCSNYDPDDDGDGDFDEEECANYDIVDDREYFIVEHEVIE